MNSSKLPEEVNSFLQSWTENEQKNKQALQELLGPILNNEDVHLDFKPRPGLTYSFRAWRKGQSRELFCMMDVIDDVPEERWLSVCFFADLINDPEEKGDIIPQGLLGDDGYCFDLDGYNSREVNYLLQRIEEAYQNAV